MTRCTVIACVLTLLLAARAGAEEELPTMVVMNFQVGKGIDPESVKLLNDLMLSEFQRAGRYRVFGEQDMVSMLNLQETRVQTTGCTDDACLAEIGGALGASFLVSSNLGRLGQKYLINMKIIDVKKAVARARSSRVVKAEEEELIGAVRAAVAEVLGGELPAAGAGDPGGAATPGAGGEGGAATGAVEVVTEGGRAEAGAGAAGRSVAWDVGAWGSAGLALALVGGATAAAVLAGKSFDELESTGGDRLDRRQDLADELDSRSLAADVMFGLAGAAAVTSVVLFIVMPRKDAAVQAGFAPTRDGWVLTVGGALPEWGVAR